MSTALKNNPRQHLPDGVTPRQASEHKKKTVLLWLLMWGFSSSEIVRQVLGVRETGYIASLVKLGLVRVVDIHTLLGGTAYMLTQQGLEQALAYGEHAVRYELNPNKIQPRLAKHHMAVQKVVAAIPNRLACLPERLIGELDKQGVKRPDALVLIDGAELRWVAIEVELSQKWGRDLDLAMGGNLRGLQEWKVACVLYVTQSQLVVNAYQEHLAKPLQVWEKNGMRWVRSEDCIDVSDGLRKRIKFIHCESLLKGI